MREEARPANDFTHATIERKMQQSTTDSHGRRRSTICWLLFTAFAVAVNSIFLITQIRIFSPRYSLDSISGLIILSMALGMPLFLAILVCVGSLLSVAFSFNRSRARRYLAASIIYIAAATIFMATSAIYRSNCVQSLARDGAPLIQAIEDFEQEHGRPPEGLDELVPRYFSEMPSTRIGSFPEYGYLVGNASAPGEDDETSTGTRWAVYVSFPAVFTEWRCLLYISDLRYENLKDVYVFYRIGAWAVCDGFPEEI